MSKNRRFTAPRLVLPMIVMLLVTLIVPQYTRAFSPNAYTWSSPNLTYTIDSSFSSLGSSYVTALNDAISDWNSSSTLVSFTQNSSSANHIAAANLGSTGGFAQTNTPYPSGTNFRFTQFALTVNTYFLGTYYVGSRSSTILPNLADLRSILRHELGHAAGLCHTWDNSSTLMWPNTNVGEVKNVDQDARDGVNYIYNPSGTTTYSKLEGRCGRIAAPPAAYTGTYDDRLVEGAEGYAITLW